MSGKRGERELDGSDRGGVEGEEVQCLLLVVM